MKFFLIIGSILFAFQAMAQQSDFILLKKNNNRTLKTYYAGSYIKGTTYNGFQINGQILNISNDTVYIEQMIVEQLASRFGVPYLDTVVYNLAIPYTSIEKFQYKKEKGFKQITVPGILARAGIGYAVLETVNTAYRREKFSENGNMQGIIGGLAIGGIGIIWSQLKSANKKAGTKYKVIYMQAAEVLK